MKCEKCGAPLEKGAVECPECGKRVGKKKLSRGAAIGISVVLIVLVVAIFATIVVLQLRDRDEQAENPSNSATAAGDENMQNEQQDNGESTDNGETQSGQTGSATGSAASYTVSSDSVTDAQLQAVVATCNDIALTNEQLAYYYWFGFSSYVSTYASYITNFLDTSAPLDEQYYDDGQTTWQAFFLDIAMQDFQYYTALSSEAAANGYQLDSYYETYLAGLSDSLTEYATNYGYESVEDYLASCFGPFATIEGYTEFMRNYLTAVTYSQSLQSSLSYTDEEVETYYDENEEDFLSAGVEKDDTRLVAVRHILIAPTDTESDEDWADAEQEATDIYNTWQNNPTEEYFAQLAENYSSDGGSNTNGGLYASVSPGQMVEEFDAWCFDPDRQVGDTGIVETPYGYHIMYFSGYGDLYWHAVALSAMISEAYSELESEILARYTLETDYEQVILVDPVGMYA